MWYIPTDLMGVPFDNNHLAIGWKKKGCVVFSFRHLSGGSLDCHFSANKEALRHIREAINDFIEWVRTTYPECYRIVAAINRNSVSKIVESINFKYVGNLEGHLIYERLI